MRTSDALQPGTIYTRKDLKRTFGIRDATLFTGIFRPSGHESIWLFVTIHKTADRTQYGDRLDGDDLWMDGQTARRTDSLLVEHERRGLEVLLFHRRSKIEHAGAGFRYEGTFRYVSHDDSGQGGPSRFHLRRVGAREAETLRVADDAETVRRGVRRFNTDAPTHRARCERLVRSTVYWVFDAGAGVFGPSKFVGFADMSFELYERYTSTEPAGSGFDGHLTRKTIERVLSSSYTSDRTLADCLVRWADRLLGPGSMDEVDHAKWRFVVLSAEADPQSEAAADAAAEVPFGGRGFRGSARVRHAIEVHAVRKARAHFEGRGFSVRELGKPYDLLCTAGERQLFVEVKGTSCGASSVVLTRNEVRFAREQRAQMVLFVVHDIEVGGTDEDPTVGGGVELHLEPWDVDAGTLSAISYEYTLPRNAAGSSGS